MVQQPERTDERERVPPPAGPADQNAAPAAPPAPPDGHSAPPAPDPAPDPAPARDPAPAPDPATAAAPEAAAAPPEPAAPPGTAAAPPQAAPAAPQPASAAAPGEPAASPSDPAAPATTWWRRLGRAGQAMVVVPLVTALIGALVGLFTSIYGPDLSDAVHGGPPVKVTVEETTNGEEGGLWWLPVRPQLRNGKLPLEQLPQALAASHAVDAGETDLKITLQGARSHKVVVTDLKAKILTRSSPRHGGTLIDAPSQGAAGLVELALDLDEPFPRARVRADVADRFAVSKPYFDSYAVTLSADEVMTFAVQAVAGVVDVTYDLVLDVVVDGHRQEITVTDGGRPFHTTGLTSGYEQEIGFDDKDFPQLSPKPKPDTCKEFVCGPVMITK